LFAAFGWGEVGTGLAEGIRVGFGKKERRNCGSALSTENPGHLDSFVCSVVNDFNNIRNACGINSHDFI
jgi:hypothetical protein